MNSENFSKEEDNNESFNEIPNIKTNWDNKNNNKQNNLNENDKTSPNIVSKTSLSFYEGNTKHSFSGPLNIKNIYETNLDYLSKSFNFFFIILFLKNIIKNKELFPKIEVEIKVNQKKRF